MALVQAPNEQSDPDDVVEYRPETANRVRSRLKCDGNGGWIEVSGPAGQCAYGLVHIDSPEFTEAHRWLYGEDSR